MKFDAFGAGISPGGLRNKNEIKILICYIVSSIKGGVSAEEIFDVFQENAFANYFEVSNALSDLIQSKNILQDKEDKSKYIITESGHLIATQLQLTVPLSIRERAISSTINLMSKVKLRKENNVEIKKTKDGYKVTCHIFGGEDDLASFCLRVPDVIQAELVKKNFYENISFIYKCLLALGTKNDDLINDVFTELTK